MPEPLISRQFFTFVVHNCFPSQMLFYVLVVTEIKMSILSFDQRQATRQMRMQLYHPWQRSYVGKNHLSLQMRLLTAKEIWFCISFFIKIYNCNKASSSHPVPSRPKEFEFRVVLLLLLLLQLLLCSPLSFAFFPSNCNLSSKTILNINSSPFSQPARTGQPSRTGQDGMGMAWECKSSDCNSVLWKTRFCHLPSRALVVGLNKQFFEI